MAIGYIPLRQRILEKTQGICAFNSAKPCDGLCNNCGLNCCETTTNNTIVKSDYKLYDAEEIITLENRCLDMNPEWG